METAFTPAKLLLEDGTVFNGSSFGAPPEHAVQLHGTNACSGEVVFNTGMVGYPESLTDPSYRGQMLTYTYPLIGNYGVPTGPWESDRIQVRGVIVSQYEEQYSHWQARQSLGSWLQQQGVPGITGIDTRALTKKLRTHGVMLGRIELTETGSTNTSTTRANHQPPMHDPNATNLVAEVSIDTPRWYGPKDAHKKIVLVDCGVKKSIIDNFVDRGIRVLRVPWNYDFRLHFFRALHRSQSSAIQCNGLVLSNGPGDPNMCKPTIAYVRDMLKTKVPQFGICLGSQIQGLAAGAKTYKLKYGHRGQNQPCVFKKTQHCLLTSQNHGFAVRERTLPRQWHVLYRNANDQSVEGITHVNRPFFSVQFHPEATPGPHDANKLFDQFIALL